MAAVTGGDGYRGRGDGFCRNQRYPRPRPRHPSGRRQPRRSRCCCECSRRIFFRRSSSSSIRKEEAEEKEESGRRCRSRLGEENQLQRGQQTEHY